MSNKKKLCCECITGRWATHGKRIPCASPTSLWSSAKDGASGTSTASINEHELNELWDTFKHQTFRHHTGGTHYTTFTAFASTSGLTIGFHDRRR